MTSSRDGLVEGETAATRSISAASTAELDGRGGATRYLSRLLSVARTQTSWLILTVVVAALVVLPLVKLQARAFEGDFAGYRDLGTVPHLSSVIQMTVLLGTASAAIALVLGTLLAWATTRVPPRMQAFVAIIPVLAIITPGVASVLGWIFIFSPGVGYGNLILRKFPLFSGDTSGPVNIYSIWAIVLFTGFALTGFVYIFMNAAFAQIGPEYEEAAVICGAGRIRVLRSVLIPLLRPALVSAAIVVLLLGLGQFTAPLLLGTSEGVSVLTTQIYGLTQSFPINYGLGAALGSPLLAVGLIVVLVSRPSLGNVGRFVVNRPGGRPHAARRGRGYMASSAIILYGVVACGLPLAAIAYVSLSPYWTGQLSLSILTTENYRSALTQPDFISTIWNTVVIGLSAVAIVLVLGVGVSLASLSTSRIWAPLRVVLDILSLIPLAIPPALMGFAVLFAYAGSPLDLYGSRWMLLVAYVTIALPYVTRMSSAAMLTVGEHLIHAARISGASAFRAFISVVVPLTRPALAGAGALVTVLLFQEFAAAQMVVGGNLQVLATELYILFTQGTYSQVAVMAVILVIVTIAGMCVSWIVISSRPASAWHYLRDRWIAR